MSWSTGGRLRRRWVLPMALVAAAILASGGIPSAADGTVGLAPGHVDESNPASRAYFIRSVAPGAGFSDFVIVDNSGGTPVPLFVNAVDGATGATSGAVYQNRVDPVVKAGRWIAPSVASLTVPAHSRVNAPFSVRVPADAAPGDHLGGIAFEPQSGVTSSPGSIAITTVVRSVIGVLVQVPGPAAFHLRFTGLEIQPLPATGTASIVVHLGDDGLRLGRPRLSVTLDGPGGYHHTEPPPGCRPQAGRVFCGQLDTVLPGDTIPYAYPWPEALAAGDYLITVRGTWEGSPEVVTYSGRYRLGEQLGGTGGERPPSPAPVRGPASGPSVAVIVLASVGATLLVVALIAATAWLARHRRRAGERPAG